MTLQELAQRHLWGHFSVLGAEPELGQQRAGFGQLRLVGLGHERGQHRAVFAPWPARVDGFRADAVRQFVRAERLHGMAGQAAALVEVARLDRAVVALALGYVRAGRVVVDFGVLRGE